MALALHDAGVPFTLGDADLHRLRATGADWIGLIPERRWYPGAGAELFPPSADVHDCACQGHLDRFTDLEPHVEWFDPPPLELVRPPSGPAPV
jgi:hypothetical protein